MLTEAKVREWLDEVKDPEIPVLSLNDLGVITGIDIQSEDAVHITMTPTFTGCPALEHMRNELLEVLEKHGISDREVTVSFETPWSSDRITERGRQALKQFGLAPPPGNAALIDDIDLLSHVPCPNCGSTDTLMKSPFGPTLCRAIHYCNACTETFEQFKPL